MHQTNIYSTEQIWIPSSILAIHFINNPSGINHLENLFSIKDGKEMYLQEGADWHIRSDQKFRNGLTVLDTDSDIERVHFNLENGAIVYGLPFQSSALYKAESLEEKAELETDKQKVQYPFLAYLKSKSQKSNRFALLRYEYNHPKTSGVFLAEKETEEFKPSSENFVGPLHLAYIIKDYNKES